MLSESGPERKNCRGTFEKQIYVKIWPDSLTKLLLCYDRLPPFFVNQSDKSWFSRNLWNYSEKGFKVFFMYIALWGLLGMSLLFSISSLHVRARNYQLGERHAEHRWEEIAFDYCLVVSLPLSCYAKKWPQGSTCEWKVAKSNKQVAWNNFFIDEM